MHEIIHLQFGPRANHIGTHLWNLAESQFQYGDDDGGLDYGIDWEVDWREGIGREVRCPSLLLPVDDWLWIR